MNEPVAVTILNIKVSIYQDHWSKGSRSSTSKQFRLIDGIMFIETVLKVSSGKISASSINGPRYLKFSDLGKSME
jgi:hypothetical protein